MTAPAPSAVEALEETLRETFNRHREPWNWGEVAQWILDRYARLPTTASALGVMRLQHEEWLASRDAALREHLEKAQEALEQSILRHGDNDGALCRARQYIRGTIALLGPAPEREPCPWRWMRAQDVWQHCTLSRGHDGSHSPRDDVPDTDPIPAREADFGPRRCAHCGTAERDGAIAHPEWCRKDHDPGPIATQANILLARMAAAKAEPEERLYYSQRKALAQQLDELAARVERICAQHRHELGNLNEWMNRTIPRLGALDTDQDTGITLRDWRRAAEARLDDHIGRIEVLAARVGKLESKLEDVTSVYGQRLDMHVARLKALEAAAADQMQALAAIEAAHDRKIAEMIRINDVGRSDLANRLDAVERRLQALEERKP